MGRERPRASPEEAARFVVRLLQEQGHTALYAGGCVRDHLLGRPASDVDVATSALPEQVKGLFRRTLRVGEQFGIVIVLYRGQQVEVATFRADGDYLDGRRPESVAYTDDPREDAQRRDFTINGLFRDPIRDEIQDWVGGREDLRRGVVRAIGDPARRFDEDKLRILRLPRFAARFGFRLDPDTAAEARRRAEEIVTAHVSSERIHAELNKMVRHPNRAGGVALLRELELGPVALPELGDLPRAERALAALAPAAEPALAWAALLHPAGAEAADAALRRLRASNKDRGAVVALLEALPRAQTLAQRPVAEQKRLLGELPGEELAELVRVSALAGDGDLEPYRYLQARRAAYADDPSPARLGAKPLIGGRDLRAGGIPPGKLYGRILADVLDAQLEGRVGDAEGALTLARARAAALKDGA